MLTRLYWDWFFYWINSCNWLIPESYVLEQDVKVQIRYNHDAKPATITLLSAEEVQIAFHEPEHAITPGQSAVFFLADAVVGGGIIQSVS